MRSFLRSVYFYFCSFFICPSILFAQQNYTGEGSTVEKVFQGGEDLLEASQGYTVSFINKIFFFLALLSLAGGLTTFFLSKERRKEAYFLFGAVVVFSAAGLLTSAWSTD